MPETDHPLARYLEPAVRPAAKREDGYIIHLASERMSPYEDHEGKSLFKSTRNRCCFTDVHVREPGRRVMVDPSKACTWRMMNDIPMESLPVWTLPSYKFMGSHATIINSHYDTFTESLGDVIDKATAAVIHKFEGVNRDTDAADMMRAAWFAMQLDVPIYAVGLGDSEEIDVDNLFDLFASRYAMERFRYNYATNFSHLVMPCIREVCGDLDLPTHSFTEPVMLQVLYRLRRMQVAKASCVDLSSGLFFEDYEYERKTGWHHEGHRKELDDGLPRSVQHELFRWDLVRNLTPDKMWNGRLELTEKGHALLDILPDELEDEGMPSRWADDRYGTALTQEDEDEMERWTMERFTPLADLLRDQT